MKFRISSFLLSIALIGFYLMQNNTNPPRELPTFLHEQIVENLSDAKISKSHLDSTWEQVKSLPRCIFVRYKLLNNHLAVSVNPAFMNDRRYIFVTQALQAVFRSSSFPNLDFIVCFDDSLNGNAHPAPIFAFAGKMEAKNILLMPDPTALDPDDREYLVSTISEGIKKNRWSSKKEAAFWRGAPSGPIPFDKMNSQDWNYIPRIKLVKLSWQNPAIIDAGFTSKADSPIISSQFPLYPTVSPKDHLEYKYLIDIDGNSCCYSRTFWILLSNSLMLKQVTNNQQWYYKGLKPFVHFVPVKENLEDLLEVIEWCKSNDKKVEEIVKEGANFAASYLHYDENVLFLSELLKEYGKHLDFDPVIEKGDITKSIIPLYGRIYHKIKGFVRKKTNKPIATLIYN